MVAALYRRYRPDSFAEMIGQDQVTQPLMTALRTGRINHAYLFSGPRGCGKTSSARILARCMNCERGPVDTPCGTCPSCVELARDGSGSLDVIEIDAASHGGVEDARDLRERAVLAPARDRYKIFIIDEAHMVTAAGFNALLKVVEEPPEHVRFVFATTEPEKVIGTIRSRTHHFPFRLIPPALMLSHLEGLCEAEGVTAEPGVLPLIVRAGGGSARDTLSLLDQIMAGSEQRALAYGPAAALLGFTGQELLDETIDAIAGGSAAACFATVDRVIQSGQDPRRFVEDLLENVRDLIIAKATGEAAASVLRGASPEELDRLLRQSARFRASTLSRIADLVNGSLSEMTGATSPRVHLELMMARLLVGLGAGFGEEAVEGGAEALAAATPVREQREAVREQPSPQAAAPQDSESPGRFEGLQAFLTSGAGRDTAPVPHAEPLTQGAPSAAERSQRDTLSPGGEDARAEAAGPAAAVRELTLVQLRDAWPGILAQVRRAGGIDAWTAVQAIQPRALAGDVLQFEVANRGELERFKRSGSGGSSPAELVRGAIAESFGISVRFQPRIAGERPRARASAAPPSAQEQAPGGGEPEPSRGRPSAAPAAPATPATPIEPDGAGGMSWTVRSIPGRQVPEDGPGSAWAEASVPIAPEPAGADAAETGTGRADGQTAPSPTVPPPPVAAAPDHASGSALGALSRADGGEAEEPPFPDPEDEPPLPAPATAPEKPAEPAPAVTPGPRARDREDPPGHSAAPAAAQRHGQSTQQRGAPAVRSGDAPQASASSLDGVARYGEPVLREILGARFISEEPLIHEPENTQRGVFGGPEEPPYDPDEDGPVPPDGGED